MKKNLCVCFCVLALAVLASCKSTNSVELFRVNANGEVVNIGRGADDGHVIYGHFRKTDAYDRASMTIQNDTRDGKGSMCYLKIDEGQVSGGLGVGVRIDPCNEAYILNEGRMLGELDDIGLYYQVTPPWGTYQLYRYENGQLVPVLTRQIFDEHWKAGIDVLRRDPSDEAFVFVTYSRAGEDGIVDIVKERVAISSLLAPQPSQPEVCPEPTDEPGPMPAADNPPPTETMPS